MKIKSLSTLRKKQMKRVYVLLIGLILTPLALSNDSYIIFSYSMIDHEEDGISDEANLNAISFSVGKNLNEKLSGELRLGINAGGDEVNVAETIPADVEIPFFVGTYLKFDLDTGLPSSISPYILSGLTYTKIKTENFSFSTSASEYGLSLGLGADFNLTESTALTLEYGHYLKYKNIDVTGISLGIKTEI